MPMVTLLSQAYDVWLTALPGLAVRALLPSTAAGLVLVLAVLFVQHLLLAALLVTGARGLRAALQSSSPASSPGNSTSVKPNWLKSRTRIG
ncbi:hypothetical protein HK414_14170 [Ramlibacter terrae]|uniref:Uncharacterized protein n=1 Tax=Ramlibacter terrae TaxID=2732511 RepID=A0ABX6P309_9BURK|nr:hypothetical protein HK414_14170 [Ramlibacter terrae]